MLNGKGDWMKKKGRKEEKKKKKREKCWGEKMDRNSNEINLGTNLKLHFIFSLSFSASFPLPSILSFFFIFSLFFVVDFFLLFLMITIRIISLYDRERTYTTFSAAVSLLQHILLVFFFGGDEGRYKDDEGKEF